MDKPYNSIVRGLEEIKAHTEGKIELKATRVEIQLPPRCDASTVKELRKELQLSQHAFAKVMGVSPKTVEAWESARNIPSGSSCRLIEMIQNDKTILKRQKIVVVS
jgi:putative transcriptional regulator